MKKKLFTCSALIIGFACIIISAYICTGCSSLKHIESSEFKRQIEMNNMQTLYWSQYIGQADGRSFILRKRVPLIGKKMKEEVLFTESDQLGEEFINKLEEGFSNKPSEAIQ